ncbi:hypothetical protein [Desulfofalx alkaliphila]|uniref:hypothetical protein n=1 Tax=Desulfofalx alkaliphila TaxID=105483 RepID=UPI0004E1AAB0|nr:hypothetical protein [Desulfofalx alkaliphila]
MTIALFVLGVIGLFFGPIGWVVSFVCFSLFVVSLFTKGVIGTGKLIMSTKCPYCRTKISRSASICPQCGSTIEKEKVAGT